MCAIELLTIEDLEGRRIWERLGSSAARSCTSGVNVSHPNVYMRPNSYQEATVEGLATSTLNGVVSSPALGGVGTATGLALRLGGSRCGGAVVVGNSGCGIDGRGKSKRLDSRRRNGGGGSV